MSQVTHSQIFLGGLGRIIDGLIWLLTFTFFKTNIHLKMTNLGTPGYDDQAWFKPTEPITKRSMIRSKKKATDPDDAAVATKRYSRWLLALQAAAVVLDGIITTISLGFVQANLCVKLTFTELWQDHAEPSFSVR